MMNSGTMSDRLKEAMEEKGREENGILMGQFASTVRREEADNGEMKEFVWVNKGEEIDFDAPDEEWQNTPGSFKVYGNWNEYAQGQDEEGNMYISDEDYPYIKNSDGQYVLDESTFEGQMRGSDAAREAEGGPGASKMEDLMEKLGQMKHGGKIGGGGGEADSDDAVITDGRYSPFIKKYQNGGEIRHGRKRLTVGTSRMGTDSGTMINPTFYADGEPVSPREAANIYKADYLRESDVEGTGAPDFNRFVQNAIMRSLTSKGQMGGMRDAVRSQQREFMEDRKKAGVKGLLRGLSKYRP